MKVAGYNLGCKVNKYELDSVLEEFLKNGYEVVEFDATSDVYIVNTCAVTQLAEKKSRQMINRAKSKNSDAIFVAAGCYTQKEGESITGVDIVVGTNNKDKIYKMVEEYIKNREKISLVESIKTEKIYDNMKISSTQDSTRAYVKIQDGCKNYCAYCIIPYLRGAVRSRKLTEVLEEVEILANKGYKEIVLAGIEVASYGEDLGDIRLIHILEETSKVKGVERIRLSSMYPTIIDEEFVNRIKELRNVCNHFHLSLQSGNDATLKRMNRKYTTDQYRQAIKLLKENIPDVAITTDIIVGFPGETEEEFESTYNFVQEMKFSKIHVFKYSKRKGTKAETLENQIDENIKNNRSHKMINLGESLEKEFLENYIGRELDVLFEGNTKSKGNLYPGHSMNYLKVVVASEVSLKNEIKRIRIDKVEKDYLVGLLK
ncbi:MAG TPA: tRNA (N(6)-L-threonylcarbamoyladenosine(37)-C(2))-methylthiotransferase MtaB [Clostridiales bacterium]|nr:MAG: tRNA (N(6)-L-threonylcarbamoyladenosine(37)-C(2))-methylthiotransferase MtaB [Clostridiales bacterium GWD2_32_59]HAN10575.1 tRNA (N(6)-L-threonylcarbamoyladenosine(37)-C(2))-methylthiotransferase MtaB [Clostridiales bacterium]